MNRIREILSEGRTRKILLLAENHATMSSANMKTLITLMMANEKILSQRAALVVDHLANQKNKTLNKYIPDFIAGLENKNLHDGIKRTIVRLLQFYTIPNELHGIAFDSCLQLFLNRKEAIAIRVFAMTAASKIAMHHEELKKELALMIADEIQFASTGMKNRGSKLLIQLS